LDQLQVERRDRRAREHLVRDPVEQPGPEVTIDEHEREVADLGRLDQRERLKQLVERSVATWEHDERVRVADEHHLAREEVMEVETEIEIVVWQLLERQLDVEPHRRRASLL